MPNALDFWKARSPFRSLRPIERSLERMFDEMVEDWQGVRTAQAGFQFSPSCEVTEDDNNYLLKFDLPGIPKDQIKIDLANNQLTVSAERKEEKKKDTAKSHVSEICYGSYMRTFTLPGIVDEKKIDAKYEGGVLTLTVPKTETTKAKHIAVH